MTGRSKARKDSGSVEGSKVRKDCTIMEVSKSGNSGSMEVSKSGNSRSIEGSKSGDSGIMDGNRIGEGSPVTGRSKTNKRRKVGIIAAALIITGLFILLIFAAFYSGLTVRTYRVSTDKLDPGQNVRIVLIADLHSCIYGENQEHLVDLIQKQEPDLIALAGDIADENEPLAGAEMFLANIRGTAPVFYVSGSHECWSRRIEEIKDMVKRHGATVLEHSARTVAVNGARLIICGVDDPDIKLHEGFQYDWKREMHDAFDGLADDPGYKILLSHRPELVGIYKEFSFDLVLSGHSHGGQVRIPFFLNGLYAPDQGWFPKYAGGVYRDENMTLIVSRGVSYNPRLPRIFNPPEVVAIDISGE